MDAYMYNTGNIVLHKDVEIKDIVIIEGFFRLTGFNAIVRGNAIAFEYIGVIEQVFLDRVKDFVERLGYDILPSSFISVRKTPLMSLNVLDMDEGAWFYEDDGFVYKNRAEQTLSHSPDKKLIDELERRGYEVKRRCDICEEVS